MTIKVIRDEKAQKEAWIEILMTNCDKLSTKEAAEIMCALMGNITVVAWNPETDLCCHVTEISVVEDAIHLLLDPKEEF